MRITIVQLTNGKYAIQKKDWKSFFYEEGYCSYANRKTLESGLGVDWNWSVTPRAVIYPLISFDSAEEAEMAWKSSQNAQMKVKTIKELN